MKTLNVLIAALFMIGSANAGEVVLYLDQARLYSTDKPMGRIIVANPSVADVSVHSNRELVLFGKMPGLTNLFVFDKDGNSMGSVQLRVANPRQNMVTLYDGGNRITLSCASVCEPTHTLGDGVNGLTPEQTDVAGGVEIRDRMLGLATGGPVNDQSVEVPESPES